MGLITKKIGAISTNTANSPIKPLGGLNNKPKLGGLKKIGAQPKEIDLDNSVSEEKETKVTPKPVLKTGINKPKIGGGLKKIGAIKKEEVKEETPKEVVKEAVEDIEKAVTFNEVSSKTEEPKEETKEVKEEVKETKKVKEENHKEEEKEEEMSPQKRAAITRKKNAEAKKKKAAESKEKVELTYEVDESQRISIDEMDDIMRPIVAPTTALWEQEKKDVLEALNNIKIEQDMEMYQVKEALADLDELNFAILPKLHDAETMYDGTKQNYDTVKAVAIAKGNATNAEGRKAEGILACQNYTVPSGKVVDLHQYMLLIEERYKFYQKISEGISFKKYSLINYNNVLKIENKN